MRAILPAIAALTAAGCGYIAEPLPPLANIPGRVNDLTAVQRGGRIIAQFTAPRTTTEGFTIKSPLDLDLRIGPGPEPFREEVWAASARRVMPISTAEGIAKYEIPAAEWTGKEVLIAARVTASNGKNSGWSSFLVLPVVSPPERPTELRIENTADGLHLTWRARGSDFRVFRRTANSAFMPVADVQQPVWTDTTTQFGQPYSYQVRTIVKLGENREAESEFSSEESLTPIDMFPPAPPAGLRALAAPNSIELSWERNTEADFASYRIYRAISGRPLEKVADVNLPSYSDHAIEHGKIYRYEISAVDQVGNESPHSAPAEAAVP